MSKKSNADMNFAERVGYYLLLGCAKLIGYLPYWVLYRVLAPFIYFVLYRLLH